ncbi:MAG: hypothetical protein OHK0013_02130 [Sandaracinaceae bacterium]
MRRLDWTAAVALLLAALWAPRPASAQTDPLAPVREQILYANYPEAIAGANAVLARTDLDARTRNSALELLATAQIASRAMDDARRTLAVLYGRDPGHRLTDPDASPPVISAFARAREANPPRVDVRIVHRAPTLTRRESPSIEVQLASGADAVDEVHLSYRQGAETGWSRVVMNRRPDGSFAARIPVVGAADQAVDVVYHVVATAPSGAELAHSGTEAEPLSLRIPAESPNLTARVDPTSTPTPTAPTQPSDRGSIAEEWWFWTIIGVVVAGAVVTGAVVATQSQGIPDGTLGTVTLMR